MKKKYFHSLKSRKGFTLIELLTVIIIIATLAVAVYAALNPVKRLQDARNARRTGDVDTILTAIHEYVVDHSGTLPAGLSTGMSEVQLGTGTAVQCSPLATGGCNVAASTACLNLATTLASYINSSPLDPGGGLATNTGYSVVVSANGIVTVKACDAEGATTISASR